MMKVWAYFYICKLSRVRVPEKDVIVGKVSKYTCFLEGIRHTANPVRCKGLSCLRRLALCSHAENFTLR